MQPHASSFDPRPPEKRLTDLRKRHIDSLVDSGAQVYAAGPNFLRQMRCHKGNLLINAATRIKAANGEHIDCWGFLPLTMIWRGNLSVQPVFICPFMEDVFVVFSPMQALGMATAEFPEPSTSDIDQQSDAAKGCDWQQQHANFKR